MAATQKERSAKSAKKRIAVGEEELRLRVRPGTRQALAELMEWSGITEQGEAMTLMIHHLHALGYAHCQPMLNPPRHVFANYDYVARFQCFPRTIRPKRVSVAQAALNH